MERLVKIIMVVLVVTMVSAGVAEAYNVYAPPVYHPRVYAPWAYPRVYAPPVYHPRVYAYPRVIRSGSYYSYPGANVNVNIRQNESWGLQGGQRSYEQSPNLEGKLIDAATQLGSLWIMRR